MAFLVTAIMNFEFGGGSSDYGGFEPPFSQVYNIKISSNPSLKQMRARFTISLLSLISFVSLRSYLFNLHHRFLFNLHRRFLFNLSPSLVLGYIHLRSLISDLRSQPFNFSPSLLSDLRSAIDAAHCH
ncbi:hypothetical protein HN873_062518 [Arachis hypogaea]